MVYVMSVVDSFVAKSAYDVSDVFISMVVCGVVVRFGGLICVVILNFTKIGQTVAEISH